jgi:YD repeat-containing protein
VTGKNGYVTRKDFDQRDNLTAVTHPDGSRQTIAYDLRFNRPAEKTDGKTSLTY